MLPMSYTFSLMAHGTQTHWLSVSLTFFGRTIPAFVAFIFIFHAIICTKVYWICFFFIHSCVWVARVFGSTRKEVHRMRNLSFLDKNFVFRFFFFLLLRFGLLSSTVVREICILFLLAPRLCVPASVCVCAAKSLEWKTSDTHLYLFFMLEMNTHNFQQRRSERNEKKKWLSMRPDIII